MQFNGLRGSASTVAYDDGEGRFVSADAMVAKVLNAALKEEKYGGLSAFEIVRAEFGPQVREVKVQVAVVEPTDIAVEPTHKQKKKQ